MAWDHLRAIHREIPPAVLTFVDARSRKQTLGYFAHSTWKRRGGSAHEIALSPHLIREPDQLLEVMVHEAAHAILHECGQNGGVGSTHYYHTKKFRDQAMLLGLKCQFRNTRYGWTTTTWPNGNVPPVYLPILQYLKGNLPAGTGVPLSREQRVKPLPPSGYTLLRCECEDGARTISVKKTVLQRGGVVCSFCGQEFRSRCEK